MGRRGSFIRNTQVTFQYKLTLVSIAETCLNSSFNFSLSHIGVHFSASVRARCLGSIISTHLPAPLVKALRVGVVLEMFLYNPSDVSQ